MFKNKKKNPPSQPLEIPYSVQIIKNHFFLKFMGPCGKSSLSRKKIDHYGYFLFNIDKKKLHFPPINYNNSSSLVHPFRGEGPLLIDVEARSGRFPPGHGTAKTAVAEDTSVSKLNSKNKLIATRLSEKISPDKKIENPFLYPLRILQNQLEEKEEGSTYHTKINPLRPLPCGRVSHQLLKNKTIGVAYGFSVFLQLVGLGYRFTLQKNEEKAVVSQKSTLLGGCSRMLQKSTLLPPATGVNFPGVEAALPGAGGELPCPIEIITSRATAKGEDCRRVAATKKNPARGYPFREGATPARGYPFSEAPPSGRCWEKSTPSCTPNPRGSGWDDGSNEKKFFVKNSAIVSSRAVQQSELTVAAGFSHKIKYLFPLDIHVFMAKFPRNKICLFGIEKEDVQNCASTIKNIHPPTTYKGKGIRMNNEIPVLRAGKKNK